MFDKKFMEMSDYKFTLYILIFTIILFVISIPAEMIAIYLRGIENLPLKSNLDDKGLAELFISIIILVPYLETIIFHALPLGIYYKLKEKFKFDKHWDFIIGGICGLFFGILHGMSYPSIIMKGFNFTIIGFLYSYVFFRYRRLNKKGRYGIWILHSLNNFIAISPRLVELLFKNNI